MSVYADIKRRMRSNRRKKDMAMEQVVYGGKEFTARVVEIQFDKDVSITAEMLWEPATKENMKLEPDIWEETTLPQNLDEVKERVEHKIKAAKRAARNAKRRQKREERKLAKEAKRRLLAKQSASGVLGIDDLLRGQAVQFDGPDPGSSSSSGEDGEDGDSSSSDDDSDDKKDTTANDNGDISDEDEKQQPQEDEAPVDLVAQGEGCVFIKWLDNEEKYSRDYIDLESGARVVSVNFKPVPVTATLQEVEDIISAAGRPRTIRFYQSLTEVLDPYDHMMGRKGARHDLNFNTFLRFIAEERGCKDPTAKSWCIWQASRMFTAESESTFIPDAAMKGPQGNTLFMYAAGTASDQGVVYFLELLLKHGADPNEPNDEQMTPLHVALVRGNETAVKYLLGIDHDAYHFVAAQVIQKRQRGNKARKVFKKKLARAKYIKEIRELRGLDDDKTPTGKAKKLAVSVYDRWFNQWIKEGKLFKPTALGMKVHRSRDPWAKKMKKSERVAKEKAYEDEMKRRLARQKAGRDRYAHRQDVLCRRTRRMGQIKLSPQDRDSYGRTALHWAARVGDDRMIRILLDEVPAKSKARQHVERANAAKLVLMLDGCWGWSALHYAAHYGRPACVATLLEHGALVYERTNERKTPLQLVCSRAVGDQIRAHLKHCAAQLVLCNDHLDEWEAEDEERQAAIEEADGDVTKLRRLQGGIGKSTRRTTAREKLESPSARRKRQRAEAASIKEKASATSTSSSSTSSTSEAAAGEGKGKGGDAGAGAATAGENLRALTKAELACAHGELWIGRPEAVAEAWVQSHRIATIISFVGPSRVQRHGMWKTENRWSKDAKWAADWAKRGVNTSASTRRQHACYFVVDQDSELCWDQLVLAFKPAIKIIASTLRIGRHVLVTCETGRCVSVALVQAYLMTKHLMRFQEAQDWLSIHHPLAKLHPVLADKFTVLEEQIRAKQLDRLRKRFKKGKGFVEDVVVHN